MNVKLLLAAFVVVVLGAGCLVGAGASAGYALPAAVTTAQAAGPVQPELDTWSAKPRPGVRAAMQVAMTVPAGAAEVEKLTLYVPAGYSIDLAASPRTVEGHVLMVTGSDFAVGDLKAVNPVAYVNTPQAQACAPGQHAAVWIMKFDDGLFSSQTNTVPIYIDPTSGDETALGAYKLQVCLPLAGIASPGGWPLGSRLRGMAMEFTRITNPMAAGVYVWRGFVSNPDAIGNPDASTTYELRSDMALPAKLSLRGRLVRTRHRAVLAGRLTTPAAPVSGITVGLYRLRSDGFWARVTTTQTSANGSYRFVRPLVKTATFGTAATAIGNCSGDSAAPHGCVNETRAEVDSSSVRIVVRRHA
jgi:hypothetical protein